MDNREFIIVCHTFVQMYTLARMSAIVRKFSQCKVISRLIYAVCLNM